MNGVREESIMRISVSLVAVTLAAALSGCANYEVNSNRGNIPGMFIRYELQEADRAVEAARKAGKDQICPLEFKAAEDAKNNAYDVFRSCRTEEGAALAKAATAKVNALCPPLPPAPDANLSVSPATIVKSSGATATLSWKSSNADKCVIEPVIGQVEPQGSRSISPSEDTAYKLTCTGPGGKAASSASISVTLPAPPPAPALPPPPPPVVVSAQKASAAAERFCNKPAILEIAFDTNKADIKPKYDGELKMLGDFLAEFPDSVGEISGHTDNVGSKAFNLKLSQRRADSVKTYLEKKFGVAKERISTKGYGFSKPIASNKTKAGKAKNRRIEANFNCK